MITARRSAWFERLFAVYNRNLIARRFEGLRVAGLPNLKDRPACVPLVLYANHSSWWDGLIAFQIGYEYGLEQYAMMEEQQLRRYGLFRKLGAFSVARDNPRGALRSIGYAGDLLRGTARALWIFPQGVTLPNDARPLNLYTGVAHIIKRVGRTYAAPVAMRYEFLDDFRPEALVRIGVPAPIGADAKAAKQLTAGLTESLARTLDELRGDVVNGNLEGYEEIVAPRRRRSM